ncbi:MAG: OmpA family protein [Bacteroidaceae bacterium]|nr:OmpA family protein [Bacteroidaceae bacterium]
MKGLKFYACGLCAALLLNSCGMSNTAKGGMIGGGGGAALGAALGALIAHNSGKGAAIGGAAGAVVGTAAGILIGKKMDKAKKAAEQVAAAQVSTVTDANGYQAVMVTFDSGILFQSGKSALSTTAQSSLMQFANNVLKPNTDMNVGIVGYTDNDPWKGKTAEQSVAMNQQLSLQRAQAVSSFLQKQGVSTAQIKDVAGLGESNPVADNSTAAGKKQNRRVEVFLYASDEMIKQAQAGTLQ